MKKNHLYKLIKHHYWKDSDKNRAKLDEVLVRLRKNNISVYMCKFLGGGVYGMVFQINKGMVLKVTEDRSEVNTMAIVKNNPTDLIVHVNDVFRCRINNCVRYFIVEEMLREATETWQNFADYSMESADVDDSAWITRRSVKRAKKKPVNELTDNNHQRYLPSKWKWLAQVAEYFDTHHIKFADMHQGNIMRRGRKHVLIDLGVSRAPKQNVDVI